MTIWNKYYAEKRRRKESEFMGTPEKKWKYFTNEEVEGLTDDLVYKLDRAREFYGFPIVITSGFRTEDQNDMAGGVKDSAHLTGQAVDFKIPPEPWKREKLAWALGSAGFRRIGMYNAHSHVDTDHTKPFPAYWTGTSS